MQKLITLLFMAISLSGYCVENPLVNIDSIKYYLTEIINNKKMEIGPVFNGRVKKVYVKRFWEKRGRNVNDTIYGSFTTPNILVRDDKLTLAADHQAIYLKLYNEKHRERLLRRKTGRTYISHYQEDSIDNYNILYISEDRRKNFNIEGHMNEIVLHSGLPITRLPYIECPPHLLNKYVAESIFNQFSNSPGHNRVMIDPKNSKIGISIQFIDDPDSRLPNGEFTIDRNFICVITLKR